MVSQAKGLMYIPVWVDDGVVKALVLDTGALPVTESTPLTELDVTLAASDITLPVSEQTPLTFIQARLLTYYGATWQAPAIEADGSLHVHLNSQEADLGIAQATPALLQPGINSYMGAAWQKQGMMWSFDDTIGKKISLVSDVAATFWIQTSDPDAGEVWRILGLSVYRSVNVPSIVRVQVRRNGSDDNIQDVVPTVNSQYFSFPFDIVLKEGQYFKAGFASATVGELCELTYWGYQMKVAM